MVRVVVLFLAKIVLGVATAVLLAAAPLPEWISQGAKEAAAFSAVSLCVAWAITGQGRLSQVPRVVVPIALMGAGMADPWVRECPAKLSEGILPFVSSVAAKVEQGAKWVRERSSSPTAPSPPTQ